MSITLAGAFLGGLLTILAPCSAALLPAFFAYAFTSRRTLLGRTGIFFLGLALALLPLGAAAGYLGSLIRTNSYTISVIGGVIVIVAGLWVALNLPVPHLPKKQSVAVGAGAKPQREPGSPIAVFVLGITYGLAGIGCSGPILGAVLAVAGISGSSLNGIITMFFYALGTFTPVLVLALLWDALDLSGKKWLQPKPIHFLGRDTTVGALVSGAIFIVLGIALVLGGTLNIMPSLLDAGQQQSLEMDILRIVSGIPNWIFVTLIALIAALIAAIWWQKHKTKSAGKK